MSHPRVDLRNPWLAGLLAFLVPGAGHVYQRRYFKGGVYFVCIFGGFLFGMILGEWKVVAAQQESPRGGRKKMMIGYLAQVSVGSLSLPAMVQSRRYNSESNTNVTSVPERMEVQFTGHVHDSDKDVARSDVRGTLTIEPANRNGTRVKARFVGNDGNGEAIDTQLEGEIELAPRIDCEERRRIEMKVHGDTVLIGEIPRPFWNWFEVPPSAKLLNDMNRRLGKQYEMALVFTWIAGLLNVVAIYDAIEGPAYGYGDEPPPEKKKKRKKKAEADA